jgi:hypothetical protein
VDRSLRVGSGNGSKERNPRPSPHPIADRYTDYAMQAVCRNVLSSICVRNYARKIYVTNILLRVCDIMNEEVNLLYSASSVGR